MSGQRKSVGAGSGKGVTSRPTNKARTAAPTPPSPCPPGEPLLHQKYRELIRKHLGKLLDALFTEYTGVQFHIAWAPAFPRQWDARSLPTGCSVCCRLTGSPLQRECRTCGPRRIARTLSANGNGHRFTCRLGVRNYWMPIRVRDQMLGIAYLQALDHSPARPRAWKHFARAAHTRLRRASARMLSRLEFARAVRFLQYIVQHVQTASLSELRKADLTSAGRAVLALEKEQARLHLTLKRHLPSPPQAPCRSRPESNAQQTVSRLIERIELDYAKPITLQHYARQLGMNAAYVSDLFSRAVGVPFKAYLTELRLEKAKELFSNRAKTAAEVAYAVGYSSESRFRMAFKKATGLCPSVWRQTMRTSSA